MSQPQDPYIPEGGRARQRRSSQLDTEALATRLIAAKRMVAGMKDAMPNMAAELRREACETIDDVIADLTAAARG